MKTLKKGKVLSAQFGKLKAYIRWAVAARDQERGVRKELHEKRGKIV